MRYMTHKGSRSDLLIMVVSFGAGTEKTSGIGFLFSVVSAMAFSGRYNGMGMGRIMNTWDENRTSLTRFVQYIETEARIIVYSV